MLEDLERQARFRSRLRRSVGDVATCTDEQHMERRAFGLCEKPAVAALEIAFAHRAQTTAVDDQGRRTGADRKRTTEPEILEPGPAPARRG